MEIQIEDPGSNAIKAYSDTELKIKDEIYTKSLIVNHETIISDINVPDIQDFNEDILQKVIQLKPEIIIFGIKNYKLITPQLLELLAKHKLSYEYMQLGSACRTYNVLLSELRKVVGVFIL